MNTASSPDPASLDHRALVALVDASRAINEKLTLDEVLAKIAEHAASVLRARGSSVLVYDAEHHELIFKTAVGPGDQELVGTRFDANLGIAGQVIRTGRPVRVADVSENRNFFEGIDAKTRMRTEELMAAPLLFEAEVFGVVEVINALSPGGFTDRDLELLQVFGNLAAAAMSHARAYDRLSHENRAHRAQAPPVTLVGESETLARAIALCRKVAAAQTSVLLLGETGTGKEVAARLIHAHSERAGKPLVALHCAALSESLLESELFGHEQGAFTGADRQKLGRFELAEGGTLFLDELGEIPLSVQVKLLRVLQEREFVRVGGTETIRANVRIIAATHRDLAAEVKAGRFREDLYYRLNVFPIQLPPLRERIEDLPMLFEHFAKTVAAEMDRPVPVLGEAARALMMRYAWPGNIRQLRNVVERCVLLSEGEVSPRDLPPEITAADLPDAPAQAPAAGRAGGSRLAENERALVVSALQENDWNQSAAARALGISRDNLRYRVRKYGIRKPPGRG